MSSSAPKVAIVGGGPAGCTLARLLIRASIPVTVFEGEASINIRPQGGTLALKSDCGIKALQEAGVYEEFTKHASYDGESLMVTDKKLKPYLRLKSQPPQDKHTPHGKPVIDRGQLRQLLVESLPPEVIRWGCRLRHIDPDNLALHFDHGVEQGYDLVVGADGAWSRVRPLLTDVKPDYVGLGGFDLIVAKPEERYPELHKLVNRGTIFAFSDGKAIFGQQKGDGSIIVSAYGARDQGWKDTCGYPIDNGAEVKKAIEKDVADWAEPLVDLVHAAGEENIIPRSIYTLPVGHRWEHHPGTTLIGDAAHLMTPYAGKGTDAALVDAMNLAHTIIENAHTENPLANLDAGVQEFEEEMFDRAAVVQEHSNTNMDLMFFTPGAPFTTIHKWVRNAFGNSWVVKVFLPLWFVRLVLRLCFWF
ncbi:hypothetical protein N7G274_005972 [Stereocaulon virgatum]|uniref:FAD-binding domain-containing protein n=1 Tax=Stereocaulon virgatum TaxID=373712 RepID=A0ABR4A7X9_9LECA